MIKPYAFIREAAKAVAKAAEGSASAVLTQHVVVQGREEEITAQLKSEITQRMVHLVKKNLNGREISGVQYAVEVFRRSQEHNIGADLMGVLQVGTPSNPILKVFLAQAKVCKLETNCWGGM